MITLLFSPSPNVFYLTGYEGSGIYIIAKNKRYLLVPMMEAPKIKGISIIRTDDLIKEVEKLLNKLRPDIIAVDKARFSLSQLEKIKTFTKAKLADAKIDRSVKMNNEIKKIKTACKITDTIFNKLISAFDFKTEAEVKAFIINEIYKIGCVPAFEPIIASGKDSSLPHYSGNKKLSKGFLVIDFGVRYKGYCSDMTRTIYLGKPSKDDIDTYNIVKREQERLINMIKPGIKCSGLSDNVDEKVKKHLIHSLGHGIGIEVHEKPAINLKSSETIEKGMCFCIEPGIYKKNYGIRIEDTLLMDKNVKILTKASKNLIIKQKF